jgi:hypothetical protein
MNCCIWDKEGLCEMCLHPEMDQNNFYSSLLSITFAVNI